MDKNTHAWTKQKSQGIEFCTAHFYRINSRTTILRFRPMGGLTTKHNAMQFIANRALLLYKVYYILYYISRHIVQSIVIEELRRSQSSSPVECSEWPRMAPSTRMAPRGVFPSNHTDITHSYYNSLGVILLGTHVRKPN